MTTEPPAGDRPEDERDAGDQAEAAGAADDQDVPDAAATPGDAVDPNDPPADDLPTGPIDTRAVRAAALRKISAPVWALVGAAAVTLIVVIAVVASTAGDAGPSVTGSAHAIDGSIPAGTSTSDGASTPTESGSPGSSTSPAAGSVADKALTPADFPAGYSASAPPSDQLANVLADISGSASAGTTVIPAECAAPTLSTDPDDASVLVATTEAGTLTVATVRVDGDLTQSAVNPCSSYTTRMYGATAKVSTTKLPPSPIQADDSVAFRRVRNTGSGENLKQTTTVLVAQNGPIRVYATYLTFGDRKLDGRALDDVFTKAVEKSRH
ncbi:hypothetical protein [Jongsikchunia kroppenstedtii]|uniref:hypothetical protein n=1 Tax=Jongsikchunia kroppenstedtii TaxID=1121721 RepID=UPI0003790E46|nr:hypothetical protein [Jongsikchunia kroppenstedtii]